MPTRTLTHAEVPTFVEALGNCELVAVDTEFHAERRYIPKLFLVQVQVPSGDAWIIDPLDNGLLERCAEALIAVPWIVHGGSQDLRLLHRALGDVPTTIRDTQIGAALVRERHPEGYGVLVSTFLGTVLPKGATLSDWSKRPLTQEQLEYAADDVVRLPSLWAAIEAELVRLGRLELCADACAEFRAASIVEADPNEAWRAFGASAGMTTRSRSILRELAAWRERVAQRRDEPPRSILGDGSLIDLAKRPPTSASAILENRRFPRAAVKHVDALWQAIQAGEKTQASQAPTCVDRFSAPWRASHTLHAWALEQGHLHNWSPRLVLDVPLIEAIALAAPSCREALAALLGPWRDALVGESLWLAISGTHHFSMRHGVLTTEDR
jgi:ribonuclease D